MEITVKQLIDKAFDLCGYQRSNELMKQAITAVNIIASDIYYLNHTEGYKAVTCLDDTLTFDEVIINDVLPYGVAAHLAELEHDGDKQNLYAAYYNRKRLRLCGREQIVDKLPRGDW